MKRISNLMCGLCLLFAACQSEDVFIDSPVASGEGNVNFMVSVPEVLETTRPHWVKAVIALAEELPM